MTSFFNVCSCETQPVRTQTFNFAGVLEENHDDFTDVSFKELVVNDCFAEPCTNGATCQNLAVGYTCLCVPGWTGNDNAMGPRSHSN